MGRWPAFCLVVILWVAIWFNPLRTTWWPVGDQPTVLGGTLDHQQPGGCGPPATESSTPRFTRPNRDPQQEVERWNWPCNKPGARCCPPPASRLAVLYSGGCERLSHALRQHGQSAAAPGCRDGSAGRFGTTADAGGCRQRSYPLPSPSSTNAACQVFDELAEPTRRFILGLSD
jgi:hypothetical protein